jgi:hypothetical protein
VIRFGRFAGSGQNETAIQLLSDKSAMKENRKITTIAACLFVIILVAGCAKTIITNRDELVTGPISRPNHIWVYNFAATPADVPAESALNNQYAIDNTSTQTADDIAKGRELGAEIASQLVEQIRTMGMRAEFPDSGTVPDVNDLVIKGYLISYDEGSALKRVTIGFGSGASDLKAAVEGFQMTKHGLRKLGYGSADSSGAKTPGMDLGAATLIVTHNPVGLVVGGAVNAYGELSGKDTVEGRAKQFADEIADVLKKRFQEQGWIK